jgi:thioredoxin-related protein
MKTLLLSLLIVSNLLAITAKEYAPTLNALTNINDAYTKAKNEKKEMILLIVIKDGCHWCEKMVEITMQDRAVKDALSNTVVVLTDFNSKLSKTYKAEQTPSMFFIDVKTKKSIYSQVGYEKPGTFMITIISAQDNLK